MQQKGELKMKLKKKGMQLSAVPGVIIVLVVLALVLSVGSTVVQDVRDDAITGDTYCNTVNSTDSCGWAFNNSDAGLKGIGKVADWQDNMGTVIGAAVIISLVMGAFVFATNRN